MRRPAAETADLARTLDDLDDADPRLSREYTRVLPGGEGGEPVVLVGVVHDHPSSAYRVRRVVDALDPDALALEVPDLLVPLFEEYAADDERRGGEMTAAIDAADAGRVVGVDAPDRRSVRALVDELVRERPPRDTVLTTLRATARLVGYAVAGRLRLAGLDAVPSVEAPSSTRSYDCSPADPPADQAADEDGHRRRGTTFLRAFEVPRATRILDAARERAMAERIDALRTSDSVVAVVGYSHLDALVDGLDERATQVEERTGSASS